jgi:glycosyltransferase involved in cell wall biosynthesis
VGLLRCGIDLDAFPYEDPGPVREPAELLCVARFVAKKGHEVLLEAVSRLIEGGTPVHLTLAGEGPLQDRIESRIEKMGLVGHVDLPGMVSPVRILELMRHSDLAVLASRVAEDGDRDGLPVALIEAAAMGLPMVGTAVSGIPELVTPDTGWIVEPDRPDLLAKTIRNALVASREVRAARARNARDLVEAEYDLDRQIEILRNL